MEGTQQTGDASETVAAFQAAEPEQHTVGYGDRYPECENPALDVRENNDATGVYHESRATEYGYDLTKFGAGRTGAERFVQLLQDIGFDVLDDYYRIYRDLGRGFDTTYPDFFLHVWASDSVMFACTSNPITGEGFSENHVGELGKAGSIGIGGNPEAVEDAVEYTDLALVKTKEKRSDGLFI